MKRSGKQLNGYDEQREYLNDVEYEVYRHGGNLDRIDEDQIADYRDEGLSYEEAARREMRRQRWNERPPCGYCGCSPCCCDGSL